MKEHDKIHEEIKHEESVFDSTIYHGRPFKIFIFLTGIFLVFLTISYLIPSSSLYSILTSRWSSFEINNNKITLEDGTRIIFQNNSYEELQQIYFNNQQHEFKACLLGNKLGKTFEITNIEQPIILQQSYNSVTAKPCKRETIISLHSHPFKRCHFSMQDLKNLNALKARNHEAFLGLMCENNRFNFFGY